ncbi:KP177R [African swine fever virus]|uniref:KP177R n=1 Tax=African swine fever virus TaxID=10497 RepID=A0A515HF64_ASF|nr:KP177R [African swine fever virus]QIA61396.1 KP177R [African swine fever virus]
MRSSKKINNKKKYV